MCNIIVGRYENKELNGKWLGWIEPEDLSWIVFVDANHQAHVYLDRDRETGAVLS